MKNITIDVSNASITEIAELIDEITEEIIDSQGNELENSKKKEWFEKIKTKFTFYKDNQKVILKDIYDTNILLQISTILSKKIYEEDQKTFNKFADSILKLNTKIKEIDIKVTGIEETVKSLQDFIKKQDEEKVMNLTTITDQTRILLVKTINSIYFDLKSRSDMQTAYYFTLKNYLDKEKLNDVVLNEPSKLKTISPAEAEIFYKVILEVIGILVDSELTDITLESYSSYLGNLYVTDIIQKELRKQVYDAINIYCPKESFVEKYKNPVTNTCEIEEFLDEEFFELDPDNFYEEILETENSDELLECDVEAENNTKTDDFGYYSEPITDINSLEEQTLSGIMHIKAGEEKVFRGLNLHLQNTINCDGSLIFDSCVINFNETEAISSINVTSVGKIKLINCMLNQHKNKEQFFITVDGSNTENNSILFKDCSFKNCNYFISCGERNVDLYNCKIIKGIQFFISKAKNCTLSSCLMNFPAANEQSGFFGRYTIDGHVSLINCKINGYFKSTESKKGENPALLFSGSLTNFNINEYFKTIESGKDYNLHYLFSKIKLMQFCTVSDVIYFSEDAFDDTIVEKSDFINCKKIGLAGTIDNCKFNQCSRIDISSHIIAPHIKICSNTSFSFCDELMVDLYENCIFEGCYRLMSYPKVKLSYFIDCYSCELSEIENSVMLRCRNMGSEPKVKNSFFDGCFGNLFDNVSKGYINNSVFFECRTENDYAVITLKGDPYNNKISLHCSNVIFYNCKVSKGSAYIIGVNSGKLKEKNINVILDKCQFLNCSAGNKERIIEQTVTLEKKSIFSKVSYETIRVISVNNCAGLDRVNNFDDKIQPPEIPLIPKFEFKGGVSEIALSLFDNMKKCDNYPFD